MFSRCNVNEPVVTAGVAGVVVSSGSFLQDEIVMAPNNKSAPNNFMVVFIFLNIFYFFTIFYNA
jgi:hypothetical protein